MRALATASFVTGTSLSLWGCGGGGTTTAAPGPAPGPTPAPTVQPVWDNHFNAFATFDVPKIMEDYDDESRITTFDDTCFFNQTQNEGYKVYNGKAEIQGFFTNLFVQLAPNISTVTDVGPLTAGEGAPVVMEATSAHAGSVFLTWRAGDVAKPITYATDSFSFRVADGKTKIHLQTIVTTEPKTDCAPAPGQLPTSGTEPIYAAWDNHFKAFGGKNVDDIMKDYTDESIVQVFDNKDSTYTKHSGLTEIKKMFTDLFAAIKAGANPPGSDQEGIEVGLLEIDPKYNSVFLAWKSFSHPQATDTFIFHNDAQGVAKIAWQTIVVKTKAQAVSEGVMV